jgi:hypothetical protein
MIDEDFNPNVDIFLEDFITLLLVGLYSSLFLTIFMFISGIDEFFTYILVFQFIIMIQLSFIDPIFRIIFSDNFLYLI